MGPRPASAPRGVLVFDLDGTLVDTSGDIVHSANYLRGELGLRALPTTEVLAAVGKGAPSLIERLTGIGQEEGARFEELLVRFRSHYIAHQTERSHVYPGIREGLSMLGAEHHLYVLSNKPQETTLLELQGQGLTGHFREIWGAGALPVLKPDPAGILAALAASAVSPDRGMMIGDMGVDVETARRAGVRSCRVAWGFPDTAPAAAEADLVVRTAAELVREVERLGW